MIWSAEVKIARNMVLVSDGVITLRPEIEVSTKEFLKQMISSALISVEEHGLFADLTKMRITFKDLDEPDPTVVGSLQCVRLYESERGTN